MAQDDRRHGRTNEPWRDLPGDPWLRPGTLRLERNGALVALLVSDTGNPPPPGGGKWVHHWLMDPKEPFPIDVAAGGPCEIMHHSNQTGTRAEVMGDQLGLFGLFPGGPPIVRSIASTQLP